VTSDREEKIRERAYAIWLDQGSIEGRDQVHWLQAEKEIAEEEAAAGSPTPPWRQGRKARGCRRSGHVRPERAAFAGWPQT
jgi:hypothetical protein